MGRCCKSPPVDRVDDAERERSSLPEVFRTIPVSTSGTFWRRLVAFIGPGYLVATGYMDPGNWATALAGGSAFGYQLLAVALISNIMAILLQALCARLGLGAGLDLAQACRREFPRPVSLGLWVLAETAIIATDLAEVIGTAIGLQLLVRHSRWRSASSSPRSTCFSSYGCRASVFAGSRPLSSRCWR